MFGTFLFSFLKIYTVLPDPSEYLYDYDFELSSSKSFSEILSCSFVWSKFLFSLTLCWFLRIKYNNSIFLPLFVVVSQSLVVIQPVFFISGFQLLRVY